MKSKLKNFSLLTISTLIMAVGIYFFKFANNFTFGGITGIAVLVAKFLPISASDFSFVVNILLLIISLIFLLLQNATTFMNDFFNLMSFGCACAYALTMISAMRIHKKYPNWVSPYKLKGGNFTRVLALIIAVVIAFFCTLGQSAGSWKSFGIYLGVGVLLWLWMVLVNWKKHPVEIETVEGLKKF